PAAAAIAETCVRALIDGGRIGSKWMEAALERPSSPVFAAAAALVGSGAKRKVVRALERALDDRARGGCAAVEAAEALLMTEALPVDDRRLDGILECAPEAARLHLVDLLLQQGAPLASVRRHCAALLLSREPQIAEKMCNALEYGHPGRERWDLMESVLALGPTEPART